MAGVRDPAFWKRFSMAVHLDEENGSQGQTGIKHTDTWLARQQRKKSRRTIVCCSFWIAFALTAGAVIGVIAYLGAFDNIREDGSSSRRMIRLR